MTTGEWLVGLVLVIALMAFGIKHLYEQRDSASHDAWLNEMKVKELEKRIAELEEEVEEREKEVDKFETLAAERAVEIDELKGIS